MNAPRRYFNIEMVSAALNYRRVDSIKRMNLVACTDQHWKMIPDMIENKGSLQYNSWMCP